MITSKNSIGSIGVDVDLCTWRARAIALTEYACGYSQGRSKDDPVYDAVTEGRDRGAMRRRYSSCGDLAHWLLHRLGVRAPWINRANASPPNYRIGANVSRLAWSTIARTPRSSGWQVQPGDILILWNLPSSADAHVCVALDAAPAGQLRTGNYGAGGMGAAASPGALVRAKALTFHPVTKAWYYGSGAAGKRVQRYLPLESAITLVTAEPDLDGSSDSA
jgi:hypothetical protein